MSSMANTSGKTRLRLFLTSSALDFIVVLIVAVSLIYTVAYGFYSSPGLRTNVLAIGALCTPLLVSMYAGAWSKRAVLYSVLTTIGIAVLMLALAYANSSAELIVDRKINDVAGNHVIFIVVVIVVCVLTYLLSRRTAGLVVLLLSAVLAIGFIQFCYREWMETYNWVPAFVGALGGIGMLFVFQCYRESVLTAKRLKKTAFGGVFLFSTAIGLLCVLLGMAAFYGIVNHLNYGTAEILLFTEVVAPPIDEENGSYVYQDSTSQNTTQNLDDTQQQTNDENDNETESENTEEQIDGLSAIAQTIMQAFNPNAEDEGYDPLYYQFIRWIVYIVCACILLLFILLVLGQIYRRTWREKRMEKKGMAYSYRVWYIYTFLMKRMRRLRIKKPDHLTPYEFVVGYRRVLEAFTRDTDGVDFLEISRLYVAVTCVGNEVSAEEIARVELCSRKFFKNARKKVGWPRWLLYNFWRI